MPRISYPNPWLLSWRTEPPKYETNVDYVQENHGTVGNGQPSLKGLSTWTHSCQDEPQKQ